MGIVNIKIRKAPVRGGESGVVNVSDYHYFTHIYRDLYICSNLALNKGILFFKLVPVQSCLSKARWNGKSRGIPDT